MIGCSRSISSSGAKNHLMACAEASENPSETIRSTICSTLRTHTSCPRNPCIICTNHVLLFSSPLHPSLRSHRQAAHECLETALALDTTHLQRDLRHLGRQFRLQLSRYLTQHISGLALFLQLLQLLEGGQSITQ